MCIFSFPLVSGFCLGGVTLIGLHHLIRSGVSQMKALSVRIVRSKICLGMFCKNMLFHLWKWHFLKLMTINLLKIIFPVFFLSPSLLSAYMPPFLFLNGRNQITYNISNHDFSSQNSSEDKTNHHMNHDISVTLFGFT